MRQESLLKTLPRELKLIQDPDNLSPTLQAYVMFGSAWPLKLGEVVYKQIDSMLPKRSQKCACDPSLYRPTATRNLIT